MRLIDYTTTNKGGGKLEVKARWLDNLRRPARVQLDFGPLETASDEPQLLMTGDSKHVGEVLHAIAEMAWEGGWRPPGFPGSLAAFAINYKLPRSRT